MVDYVYKNSYIEIVAGGGHPAVYLRNHDGNYGGACPVKENFGRGWYIDIDSVLEALQAYKDNGYKVVPETVAVPLSELKAMKARIEELEKGGQA